MKTGRIGMSGNFTQVLNSILEESTMSAYAKWLYAYFLSKPPGWRMRIDDVASHCTNKDKPSLRRYLRELKMKGIIDIRSSRDRKTKKFAGSYYILKETSEEKAQAKGTINDKKPSANQPEQTCHLSRGSARTESLHNEGGHNNTDITNSNTNYMFIESNIIDDEEIFDEEPDSAIEKRGRISKSWDAERTRLYDGAINKRSNNFVPRR